MINTADNIIVHALEERQDSSVRDYIALMKPRVMSLVVFSAIAGIYLAPGTIHPFLALIAVICVSMGAGAAGAINMWYDRDIDAVMLRTRQRPIVQGKIEPDEALMFGVLTAFFAVLCMMVCINILAGMLLAASILFYVFIYTIWLKRSSVQNIVIGGAAGSLPPMIGWAAVTNNISAESIALFLLIFFWTPPHFWALALYKGEDYKRCNVPMMPIVHGSAYTKKYIFLYTIFTSFTSYLPCYLGAVSLWSALPITVLNLFFLFFAFSLFSDKANKKAPRLFGYSILYLFAVFAVYMIAA